MRGGAHQAPHFAFQNVTMFERTKGKILTMHLTTHHHLPTASNVSNTILRE